MGTFELLTLAITEIHFAISIKFCSCNLRIFASFRMKTLMVIIISVCQIYGLDGYGYEVDPGYAVDPTCLKNPLDTIPNLCTPEIPEYATCTAIMGVGHLLGVPRECLCNVRWKDVNEQQIFKFSCHKKTKGLVKDTCQCSCAGLTVCEDKWPVKKCQKECKKCKKCYGTDSKCTCPKKICKKCAAARANCMKTCDVC